MDDVELTFDSAPFLKGLDEIRKAITDMNEKMETFGKESNQSIKKSKT